MSRLLLSLTLISLSISQTYSRTPFNTLKKENPSTLLSTGSDDLYCKSWRFAAESDDLNKWNTTAEKCIEYVKAYLYSGQYESDSYFVAQQALDFAKSIDIADDGKDVFIFDIDETLISNLGRLGWNVRKEFVVNMKNSTVNPPALPASLWLYNELKEHGFQVMILSTRLDSERNETIKELENAGYHSWTKLTLMGVYDSSELISFFKADARGRLVEGGYRIRGNVGDQWSDLWGPPMAERSFKLPNPMYYLM